MAKKLISVLSIILLTFLAAGCRADSSSAIDKYFVKKDGVFYAPYCDQNGTNYCTGGTATKVISLGDVIGRVDPESDKKIIETFKRINKLPNDAEISMDSKLMPGNKYYFRVHLITS
jgi:hypothetical protein